jgi:hypothetical protein
MIKSGNLCWQSYQQIALNLFYWTHSVSKIKNRNKIRFQMYQFFNRAMHPSLRRVVHPLHSQCQRLLKLRR